MRAIYPGSVKPGGDRDEADQTAGVGSLGVAVLFFRKSLMMQVGHCVSIGFANNFQRWGRIEVCSEGLLGQGWREEAKEHGCA